MYKYFVDAARYLTQAKDEIPRTAWLRSSIAAIPASPAFRPHCCQNYASDLGIRYRPDPKNYLTEVPKSIAYVEPNTMNPKVFYDEWVQEGSNERILACHFDAKQHWEIAACLSAAHGLVTPLNALRKGLAVVYGKLGDDDRGIEVYDSIASDPAGLKLLRTCDHSSAAIGGLS